MTDNQIKSVVEYLEPYIRKNNIRLEDITTHEQVRKNYMERHPEDKNVKPKHDLNQSQYNQVMNALKENIYYKKESTNYNQDNDTDNFFWHNQKAVTLDNNNKQNTKIEQEVKKKNTVPNTPIIDNKPKEENKTVQQNNNTKKVQHKEKPKEKITHIGMLKARKEGNLLIYLAMAK